MCRSVLSCTLALGLFTSTLCNADAPRPAAPQASKPGQTLAEGPLRSLLPQPVESRFAPAENVETRPFFPQSSRGIANDHLRQAVDHLRQAGFDNEANDIQHKADELQNQRLSELQDKRRDLQQLQCLIAELEQEVGETTAYQIDFLVGEISTSKSRHAHLNAEELQLLDKIESGIGVFPTAECNPLFEKLKSSGAFTVRSQPRIVAQAGRRMSLRVGPASPGVHIVQTSGTRETAFSFNIDATIEPVGDNRVRLQMVHDVSSSAKAGESPIDSSSSIQTRVEMKLDDTLVLGGPDQNAGNSTLVKVIVVSPGLVELPIPLAQDAKLEPVPETTSAN